MIKNRGLFLLLLLPALTACGGFTKLKVVDYTEIGRASWWERLWGYL